MAITREKKEALVAEYKEKIEGCSALVFTDYRGVTVSQIQTLRTKLGENNAGYTVVKNRLFGLALDQTGQSETADLLDGPNAVVFLGEDIGKGVTALKDWLKGDGGDIVEIKGAILDNSVLDSKQAEALADLPTKEQTLAMILGTINAPASSLARMLNAPGASLARVLNARVEKMKEEA